MNSVHSMGLMIPLLIEAVHEPRRLTLRTYEELIGNRGRYTGWFGGDSASVSPFGQHATARPAANTLRETVDGAALDARFSGRVFCELGSVLLDLDDIETLADWTDHGHWLFPVAGPTSGYFAGVPRMPLNLYPESIASKHGPRRYARTRGHYLPLEMYVPFATQDFADATCQFHLHPDYGLIGNLPGGTEMTTNQEIDDFRSESLPGLVVSGPITVPADGDATLSVQVTDGTGAHLTSFDPELHVEATAGYLPRRRVATASGAGSFKIRALGMANGEQIRVKVGYKNYPLVEHVLTVGP